MQDGRFEWDDAKAARNLAKHGVSFEDARAVFDDPHAIVEADRDLHHEQRLRTIGSSGSRVLFVVSTDVDDGVTRIISARRATRHEEDRYHRQAPY